MISMVYKSEEMEPGNSFTCGIPKACADALSFAKHYLFEKSGDSVYWREGWCSFDSGRQNRVVSERLSNMSYRTRFSLTSCYTFNQSLLRKVHLFIFFVNMSLYINVLLHSFIYDSMFKFFGCKGRQDRKRPLIHLYKRRQPLPTSKSRES